MDLQTYLRFQSCEVAIRKKLRYDGEIMNFSSLNWNMDACMSATFHTNIRFWNLSMYRNSSTHKFISALVQDGIGNTTLGTKWPCWNFILKAKMSFFPNRNGQNIKFWLLNMLYLQP
jgi:hypothetical protein